MIHAGLYYGPSSLKTRLCLSGKRLLYDLCVRERIPYRVSKKWIMAQNSQQCEELLRVHEHAKSIGVPTHFIPLSEAKLREPDVRIRTAVLESPTTGIVDSHALMSYLEADIQARGADISFHTSVTSIEPLALGSAGYKITTVSESSSESYSLTAETLINSAGLSAVPLSNRILPPSRQIKPLYAKGSYYSYSAPSPRPKTLLYPAPTTDGAGLGIHLTMDLTGSIRFGPDVEWVDDPNDLSIKGSGLPAALDEIETYLPNAQKEKIMFGYCGIRPKLGKGSIWATGKGVGFSDFIIRKEDGFEGFINLLGIESPGLTSSLAIAEMVHDLLYR